MDKKIYTTKDYSLFKKLEGNRIVTRGRTDIIKNSIQKVGYITNPIIVNEKMEIIEGQGRYQALKELKLPIDYIIEKDAGIEECIALNMKNTNWKLQDFIESYANRGYDSYKKLFELMNKYSLGLAVLATAVKLTGKFDIKVIKDGNLQITDEEYNEAVRRLDWISEIAPYCKNCPGGIVFLLQALILCEQFEGIDMERLKEKIKAQNATMMPFSNLPDCMKSLEQLYNQNKKAIYQVYIFTEYRKWIANYRKFASARNTNNSYRRIY